MARRALLRSVVAGPQGTASCASAVASASTQASVRPWLALFCLPGAEAAARNGCGGSSRAAQTCRACHGRYSGPRRAARDPRGAALAASLRLRSSVPGSGRDREDRPGRDGTETECAAAAEPPHAQGTPRPRAIEEHGRTRTRDPRLVLYRGPYYTAWRFAVRSKVIQLLLFGGASGAVVSSTNAPDMWGLAAAAAAVAGSAAASACLWFYAGRYVGELSLVLDRTRLPDTPMFALSGVLRAGMVPEDIRGAIPVLGTVRFSVLDFWGNREDTDVPIELVAAPLQGATPVSVQRYLRRGFQPLACSERPDSPDGNSEPKRKQYVLALGRAHVQHRALLMALLDGSLRQRIADHDAPTVDIR